MRLKVKYPDNATNLRRWPKNILSRAIFLHSDSGLGFGDYVLVKADLERPPSVFRAFPSRSKKLRADEATLVSEALAALGVEDGSFITVESFSARLQTCKAVRLSGDVDIGQSFNTAVALTVKDAVVTLGTVLVVSHYGKQVHLTVQHIDQDTADKTEDELSATFQSVLSVTEGPASTSTPVKAGGGKKFVAITEKTKIQLGNKTESKPALFSFDKTCLGGLDDQLNTITGAVSSLFGRSQKSYLGILLYGPSGTGKSLLAKCVASDFHREAKVLCLNGSEMFSKYSGETEARLRDKFDEARDGCCILVADEFDTLCPKTDLGRSDQERRVVSCLRGLVDDCSMTSRPNQKTILLAITSRPDLLDPTFRRPGRLDLEVEISVPSAPDRVDILDKVLRKRHVVMCHEDLEAIGKAAHGFVGADLEALCSTAINGLETKVDREAFARAFVTVKPSAMREVQVNVPSVTWEDIGGLDGLKLQLRQAVEWPLKYPEIFERMGMTPPKGVLMYGPPGCSKTMIAKALANESKLNFLAVKGPELFSKYVGESEQAVRALFRKARRVSPCIIFFDEIDALGSQRGGGGGSKVGDRVLSALLTEMDGIEQLKNVTIVAATNRPDMIDSALMRPGRLDRRVYVPLPDKATRLQVFAIHTKRKPLADNVDLETMAERTEGYSGAEIASICNTAALKALEEAVEDDAKAASLVTWDHFEAALKAVRPRITQSLIKIYDVFHEA